MTIEEARKVACVVSHADSGCPSCVGSVIDRLTFCFPEFDWVKLVKQESNPMLYQLDDDFEVTPRDPYER